LVFLFHLGDRQFEFLGVQVFDLVEGIIAVVTDEDVIEIGLGRALTAAEINSLYNTWRVGVSLGE
jgi:hypothetical protein